MTNNDDVEARDIASRLLDQTGRALVTGDFELFAPCFHLPQVLSSQLGERTLLRHEEVQEVFERVRWHYRGLQITKMQRRCMASMFVDHHTILSVHRTRLLRGADLVQKPFKALSTITQVGGVWRIKSCDYAIKDSLRHNRAIHGTRPPATQAV
ncbi:MAG: hypothetical protein AAF631_02900 [Pseudomonadota bacterium]